MGRGEVFTGFWLGGPKVKRPLGRPRRRWEDNIKMDLGRQGSMDSTVSGQGPVARFCKHNNEPSGSIMKAGFFDKLSDNQLFK
jgi:hypothetical protein